MRSHPLLKRKVMGGFFTSWRNLLVKAIGIDPGLAMTGFGVVETLSRGGKACEWGAIRTEVRCPVPVRLKMIYDRLKEFSKNGGRTFWPWKKSLS